MLNKQKMETAVAATEKKQKGAIDHRYYYAVAVGAGSLILALGLGLLVIRPMVMQSLTLGKDIQYRNQEVSLLTKKRDDLKILKNNYLALGTDTQNKILVALPVDEDQPHLTTILSSVAGQSGVTLASVGYTDSASSSGTASESGSGAISASSSATSLPATVTINGPYANIVNFMVNAEQSARLIDVTSVNLSGSGSQLQGTVTMKAYYNSGTTQ